MNKMSMFKPVFETISVDGIFTECPNCEGKGYIEYYNKHIKKDTIGVCNSTLCCNGYIPNEFTKRVVGGYCLECLLHAEGCAFVGRRSINCRISVKKFIEAQG